MPVVHVLACDACFGHGTGQLSCADRLPIFKTQGGRPDRITDAVELGYTGHGKNEYVAPVEEAAGGSRRQHIGPLPYVAPDERVLQRAVNVVRG